VTVIVNEELLTHALAAYDEPRGTEGPQAGDGADHALGRDVDPRVVPPPPWGLDEERPRRAAGEGGESRSAAGGFQKRPAVLDSDNHDGSAG
jgi:hypothetical protein